MTNLQLQSLISAIDQAETPARLVAAVRALASARLEAAIPTLIAALGYNNPGAAIVAVDGLVQLGEVAVVPLLQQLDDYNYGARAYAVRALAAIGDVRALDVLLSAAATDFAPSVRRAAAKGLGTLHWHQLATRQRGEAQSRTLHTLLQVVDDPDWAIRYAAIVGLEALGNAAVNSTILQTVSDRLQVIAVSDSDSAIQARATLAYDHLIPLLNQQLTGCC